VIPATFPIKTHHPSSKFQSWILTRILSEDEGRWYWRTLDQGPNTSGYLKEKTVLNMVHMRAKPDTEPASMPCRAAAQRAFKQNRLAQHQTKQSLLRVIKNSIKFNLSPEP
jgi:hypothetical protein